MSGIPGSQTWAVAALLAAVVLGFWIHRIHLDEPSQYDIGNLDIEHAYLPWTEFLGREIAKANLPIWNPYQFAGQPFLAIHMPGILYPPNLLLSGLLPAVRALEATAILHMFLAGFFTFLYLHRIGLGWPAQVAGAIGYVLSGPVLCAVYIPGYLIAAAWLPAVLWALHGLLAVPRAKWALLLAVFLSASFLGGHAQGFLFIVQFGVVYGLAGLATLTPRSERTRLIGLVLVAGVATIGLTAPQLLPAIELVHSGVRGFGGHGAGFVSHPSVRPEMLLRALAGGLGQDLSAPAVYRFTEMLELPMHAPYSRLFVLPKLGIPLVLCGLLASLHRRYWLLYAFAAVVMGFFLVGPASPVFSLYAWLPWGTLFRGTLRADFLFAFLLGVLTALGVEGVGRWVGSHHGERLGAAVAIGLTVLLAIDLYSKSEMQLAHPGTGVRPSAVPSEVFDRVRRSPGRERIFLELSWFEPVVAPKSGMLNQVFVVPDYEPNMPSDYERYFEPTTHAYGPWHGMVTLREYQIFHGLPLKTLFERLDLMSVRFYGMPLPAELGFRRDYLAAFPTPPEQFGDFALSTRPSAVPRAYAVGRVIPVGDFQDALSWTGREDFDSRVEAVVVETDVRSEALQELILAEPSALDSSVSIVSYETEEIVVDARCERRCLVVLTDLNYGGWKANVDGNAASILTTNALFRGVVLEPGRHVLRFHYLPASYLLGLGALSLTLLGICGTWLYAPAPGAVATPR